MLQACAKNCSAEAHIHILWVSTEKTVATIENSILLLKLKRSMDSGQNVKTCGWLAIVVYWEIN